MLPAIPTLGQSMNPNLCLGSQGAELKNRETAVPKSAALTPDEQHRLLVEWNATQMDYPVDRCVHQLFEEQAARTPDATAVVFENQQLSYAELNSRANGTAERLVKLGVKAEDLVGICVERSPDMIAALLGIMKAGGAYVPLDPRYPPGRLSFMLQDSGLKFLITQESLRSKLGKQPPELVCVDVADSRTKRRGNYPQRANADNLAYVIYTSGSTGEPKGVEICHRSLVNFLTSMQRKPGLESTDTLVAVTTISFDIAALELYLPLMVGARVVLVSRETAADGNQLGEILERTGATAIQATPATWRLLLEAGWQGSKKLKVLCGGEALPPRLAGELLNRAGSVWNMYGPTETTVWSTTSEITCTDGAIPIGRPIANTTIYVLDKDMELVRVGVAGELYIGGAGVARGYLHRPGLTAEKFIPNPFGGEVWDQRLYKTGDLARYREDGQLECLGRVDHQVKVRGFRIELEEIETVLNSHARIRQSVMVAEQDGSEENRLVAYLVAEGNNAVSVEELREFAARRLPEYMLPSHFEFLDNFPLTPNGKVDRKALPVPRAPRTSKREEYVVPRNDLEFRLAEIWCSVLDVQLVGVRENFFELGGHSLLVARLLARIERAFGKKLTMAAIFEAPTIEQQAAVIGNGSVLRWPPAVAPIQPGGMQRPFFCFGFGAGPVFRSLAGHLGPAQPLLGVDPTLLDGNLVAAPYRMEEVAASLAMQMQEVQRSGPYYLGGICGGGLLAYATATRLIELHQEVALLALFEPHPSYHANYVEHANGFRRGWFRKRLEFHLENLRDLESAEAVTYLRDHVRERSRVFSNYVRGKLRIIARDVRPYPRTAHNILEILGPACEQYRPKPFAGRVVLFQATHREPGGEWEREFWKGLAVNLAVHEVPGYSNWIVRFFIEPNVSILAAKLREYLPGQIAV